MEVNLSTTTISKDEFQDAISLLDGKSHRHPTTVEATENTKDQRSAGQMQKLKLYSELH